MLVFGVAGSRQATREGRVRAFVCRFLGDMEGFRRSLSGGAWITYTNSHIVPCHLLTRTYFADFCVFTRRETKPLEITSKAIRKLVDNIL